MNNWKCSCGAVNKFGRAICECGLTLEQAIERGGTANVNEDVPASTASKLSNRLGTIGAILMVVGFVGLFIMFSRDTTVETLYGKVHNVGLMNDKQNGMILYGVGALVGAMLIVAGRFKNK